jgi:hypothetical protein
MPVTVSVRVGRLRFPDCCGAPAPLLTGFTGGLTGLVLSRLMVGLGEAGTIPTATRAITN